MHLENVEGELNPSIKISGGARSQHAKSRGFGACPQENF